MSKARGVHFRGPRVASQTVTKSHLALLLTFGFSLLGVVGDYFLKVSSLSEKPFRTAAFYIGFAVYGSTAFGWLFAMRNLKLATISTVYSVSIILLLTTLGVVVFQERLSATEVVGIVLALASLVLLVRFA
jgi:small multidrug resistance pump